MEAEPPAKQAEEHPRKLSGWPLMKYLLDGDYNNQILPLGFVISGFISGKKSAEEIYSELEQYPIPDFFEYLAISKGKGIDFEIPSTVQITNVEDEATVQRIIFLNLIAAELNRLAARRAPVEEICRTYALFEFRCKTPNNIIKAIKAKFGEVKHYKEKFLTDFKYERFCLIDDLPPVKLYQNRHPNYYRYKCRPTHLTFIRNDILELLKLDLLKDPSVIKAARLLCEETTHGFPLKKEFEPSPFNPKFATRADLDYINQVLDLLIADLTV